MNGLQELRDVLGVRITVTSGFRCRTHNAQVKGASPNSWHTKGRACDIQAEEKTPEQVFEAAKMIEAFESGGIGIYDNRVHVDSGDRYHRWDNRKKES